MTRAVKGLLRFAIASASSSRPLPLVKGGGSVRAQNREETARRFIPQGLGVAAQLDPDVRWFLDIADRVHERILRRQRLLEPGQLGSQRIEVVLPLAAQKAIELSIAVVENSSLAEEISPQEIAVTFKRLEIGVGERLAGPCCHPAQ